MCLTSAIIVLYRFRQAVSYVLLICTRRLATHVTCYLHHLARSEFVKKILWYRIFDGEYDGAGIPCTDRLINDCRPSILLVPDLAIATAAIMPMQLFQRGPCA